MSRFEERIFGIENSGQFEAAALELFRFQSQNCAVYREYIGRAGIDPSQVRRAEDIPMLPVELFKHADVYCGDCPPEEVFTSSSTSGTGLSRHPMFSLEHYERAFTESFRRFYGEPSRYGLYALLPNYLSRKGSSLVYMCDRLIKACGSGGFYLDRYDRLLDDMARDPKPKILLGVSYALWELAERFAPPLSDTVVMETGGMKGRREELPKEDFHAILCQAFGVSQIHSEYGMAELTSQAYSCGGGIFRCPPWMKVYIRDINDPFDHLTEGARGGIDIIDLANCRSCAFISVQDTGRCFGDGSFTVEGRIDRSDIRGCNLLVQ